MKPPVPGRPFLKTPRDAASGLRGGWWRLRSPAAPLCSLPRPIRPHRRNCPPAPAWLPARRTSARRAPHWPSSKAPSGWPSIGSRSTSAQAPRSPSASPRRARLRSTGCRGWILRSCLAGSRPTAGCSSSIPTASSSPRARRSMLEACLPRRWRCRRTTSCRAATCCAAMGLAAPSPTPERCARCRRGTLL